MADYATDGTRLYTAELSPDEITAVINGVPSPFKAPEKLIWLRIAASPGGQLALTAHSNSAKAYGCIWGQPWKVLGPSNRLTCVAWTGVRFEFAFAGPGGDSLVTCEIKQGAVQILSSTKTPAYQGILYYDTGDRRFVPMSQIPVTVGGYTLYHAVRILVAGRWMWNGQRPGTPDSQLVTDGAGVAFIAGPQVHVPQLVAIGTTLYTNHGKVWAEPYPSLPEPPKPEPPDPPEPPMSAKATIASYDAQVTLPGRGTAVAKITAGTPTHLRWQYHDQGSWKTASTQPASDLTVEYAFPRAGQFPIRLQTLVNGEVTDQSSSTSRVVTVQAAPIPPEPIPPQPPSDIPEYDRFVNVECPQVVETYRHAHGHAPSSQDMGHNSYRRLALGWTAAEVQQGIVDVSVNYDRAPWFGWVPVDYPTFVNTESPEVAAAYRSTNPDPSVPTPQQMGHTAWRRFAEFWTHRDILHDIKGEPLEDGGAGGAKPPTPPTGETRKGVVRGENFCVRDDGGVFLAFGTSLFWALRGYLDERDRLDAHLEFIRGMGCHFIRVIATGLRKGTTERSLSPGDPRFVSALAGLIDHAYDRYGLRTQITVFGAVYDAPTRVERQSAVDKVCSAIASRPEKVWLVEIANEGWTNGFEDDAGTEELRALADRVAGKIPNLVATTTPRTTDDVLKSEVEKYYKNCRASVQTIHFSRNVNPPDGYWRPVRKPWREQRFAVEGCAKLVQNNEPIGPDSSVNEDNDPTRIGMAAAVSYLCGVGSYLLHCGAGIYGLADPARGRPANLWETARLRECAQAIRTVIALLPPTLPNWQKIQVDSSSAPFRFVDVPEEQFTSAYVAQRDRAIIQLPIGVVRETRFTLKQGSCTTTLFDPVTGEAVQRDVNGFTIRPANPGVIMLAERTS